MDGFPGKAKTLDIDLHPDPRDLQPLQPPSFQDFFAYQKRTNDARRAEEAAGEPGTATNRPPGLAFDVNPGFTISVSLMPQGYRQYYPPPAREETSPLSVLRRGMLYFTKKF